MCRPELLCVDSAYTMKTKTHHHQNQLSVQGNKSVVLQNQLFIPLKQGFNPKTMLVLQIQLLVILNQLVVPWFKFFHIVAYAWEPLFDS